jgi:hypothetical protein
MTRLAPRRSRWPRGRRRPYNHIPIWTHSPTSPPYRSDSASLSTWMAPSLMLSWQSPARWGQLICGLAPGRGQAIPLSDQQQRTLAARLARKLERLGIEAGEEHFYTSALATPGNSVAGARSWSSSRTAWIPSPRRLLPCEMKFSGRCRDESRLAPSFCVRARAILIALPSSMTAPNRPTWRSFAGPSRIRCWAVLPI